MFAEDLSVFFGDFGQMVTLRPFGEDVEIEAIFFNSPEEISQLEELNSPGPPVALVKTEDLADIDFDHAEYLAIGSEEYNILTIEPDGTGFSKLTLEKKVDA